MSKRVRLGRTSPEQTSHTYEMAHLRGVGCSPVVGPRSRLTLMTAQFDFWLCRITRRYVRPVAIVVGNNLKRGTRPKGINTGLSMPEVAP